MEAALTNDVTRNDLARTARNSSRDWTWPILIVVAAVIVLVAVLAAVGWFTGIIKPKTFAFIGQEDAVRQAMTGSLTSRYESGTGSVPGTVSGSSRAGRGLYFDTPDGAEYLLFTPTLKVIDRIGRVVTLQQLVAGKTGAPPIPPGTPAVLVIQNGTMVSLRLQHGVVTP